VRISPLILVTGCRGFFNVPAVPDAGADAEHPVTYVQSAAESGSIANVVLDFPLPEQVGDANVVVLAWPGAESLVAVSDSGGNTYASAVGPTATAAGWTQQIFVATNIKPGPNRVTATFSAGGSTEIAVLEYTNLAGIDTSATRTGLPATSPFCTPVTTTSAHDLIFAALTSNSAVNTTQLVGLSSRASDAQVVTADDEKTQLGMYATSSPAMASTDWVLQLVAFRAK
jgi:hypothetical protein